MSETSNLWYFENVDLFNVLCPHKVKGMDEKHIPNLFKKDQFIYFPEENSQHIYMIAEGRVKIGSYTDDGKEIVKAILGKGELFGEMALAGEDKRSDFAQSMDNNTTVCIMSLDDMNELMANNKPLSFKLLKIIGLRLRKVERRLESLVFKDARTRIVDFLRDQAEEKGQKVGYETMIPSYLTHKDIASLTGTSRQTVTTVLNELRDKNLINFDRRKILIRDMDKLA
ncbi:Crp/Fnr family transcriptional regulator [Marivirga sp. S37H4]|uniref:Crp/Fnr family transcriptional regulator n=1 Tax=Marivirga aurantiaca TaxID=2802615 RepID=A0A934WV51_9BACT|nr:Crp/Fnr family transcriptional regulator [Marivirga aurantiaca]MBK6263609.1 Crp/Fnr family transcriptional regulator [Marivirga aurantiaca]